LAELDRRFYIPEHLHPAMRFDIYADGLVVMYVYGVEITRKTLRSTFNPDIFRAFAEELAAYGIGIAPMGELGEIRKRVSEVEKGVTALEKEVKRLRKRK